MQGTAAGRRRGAACAAAYMHMKTVKESVSTLSQVMLPGDANPAGTVHGGEIMKIMDTCGGVAATRHARRTVVTVRVDELRFYHPIYVGELLICESKIVFAGHTSMEAEVIVRVDNLTDEDPVRTALKAYFTYVALDDDRAPCAVPKLKPETDEEKAAFETRRQKYLARKQGRAN